MSKQVKVKWNIKPIYGRIRRRSNLRRVYLTLKSQHCFCCINIKNSFLALEGKVIKALHCLFYSIDSKYEKVSLNNFVKYINNYTYRWAIWASTEIDNIIERRMKMLNIFRRHTDLQTFSFCITNDFINYLISYSMTFVDIWLNFKIK